MDLKHFIRVYDDVLDENLCRHIINGFDKEQNKILMNQDSIKFATLNLRENMYDEEGENVGWFFQHPVSLEKERLELI